MTETLPAAPALLDALRHQLRGDLYLPGQPGYETLATPWNVAVPDRPAAVVAAADADDVAAAVRFAGVHGLEVAVQATGHGAASQLAAPLLISTARMTDCCIDPVARVARVGAGVRWTQVLDAAAPYGLAGLAGSAPGVGVVGYTTGGGLGPLARTLGLASDRVRSFEVVTGDGQVRTASATENRALFWALRGGKGALGVVTTIEFELLPIPEILGGAVFFDGADAPAVLDAWRTWCAALPLEATTSIALQQLPPLPGVPEPLAGRLTVAVRFAWTGDPAQGERVFAPMLAAGRPILGGVGVMPYAALGAIHADPVDPMPVHEASTVLADLPAAAADKLLEFAGPGSGSPQLIVELRQLGGAIASTDAPPSAFCHRNGAFALTVIGLAAGPAAEPTAAHADALVRALAPWSTGGLLPNLAASENPAATRRRYDQPTLTRLATLIAAYDPQAVLRAGGAIREACDRRTV